MSSLYTATRFPNMRVHFYGAGVGGDRVTGGGGGPIDQRLERDVFAEKPTVVTIMLGMNDGSYRATTPEIENTYVKGYEHLLDSIHEHAPAARITLLGPSPYDDVTRAVDVSRRLQRGDAALRRSRQRSGAEARRHVRQPQSPAWLRPSRRRRRWTRRIAKLLVPDRVHPDPLAHWIMAEALLKGWNAPALVSSVTIDAAAGKLIDAQNATVEPVARRAATRCTGPKPTMACRSRW